MLKDLLKDANDLYLATDEDREGEAISWHLLEVLSRRCRCIGWCFTKSRRKRFKRRWSIRATIDDDLVRAQETRRILDRLYGYEVSPLLWRKVRPKLSAGRVQSVAVRMIVERERERMAFVSATWWDLHRHSSPSRTASSSQAELVSVDGRQIPAGKDFDSADRQAQESTSCCCSTSKRPRHLAERVRSGEFRVTNVEDKPYTSKPYPPFTTSTLQQEANRKLGFTARRTMQVAQSLYENGHITYMRTDSTNLAQVAIDAARESGARRSTASEYLPDSPRSIKPKSRTRRKRTKRFARPAIRSNCPAVLRDELNADEFKLVRPDLEADDRQPDGRCPRPADHDHDRRRRRACFRSAARRSTSPAICGPMSKAATIRRPSWPIRKRCCRALTVGEALEVPRA